MSSREPGIPDARSALDRVRGLVLHALQGRRAAVYLFGSWASGTPGPGSDIDVAIDPLEPLPPGVLARVRETLEESTVPYRVDVVDLGDTASEFRERVIREGIPWTGSASG